MDYQQLMDLSLRFRNRADAARNGLSHDIRADIFDAIADEYERAANDILYPLSGRCAR